MTEWNISKEASYDYSAEYPLKQSIDVKQLFSFDLFRLFRFITYLFGNRDNHAEFGLNKLVIEETAHNFSLIFPLLPLTH
jgi:hypothetical protein